MFKLRVAWHQACQGCGIELAVDVVDGGPVEYICPWCGTLSHIEMDDGSREVLRNMNDAILSLESQMNSNMSLQIQ